MQVEPLRVRGTANALWLTSVVVAVAVLREPAREAVILALAGISLWRAPR